MSFLSRVNNFRTSLTPNEEQVVKYLCRNPEKTSADSIQEVAKNSGVSIASVSRLAATLGYRDWKELRLGLAKEAVPSANPVLSDIAPGDSNDTIVKKVFTANIASLQQTLEQLPMDDIMCVVNAIQKTNRIVFFGSGGSGCIARDESLRFAHLALAAEAYSEEFQMMLQASRMRKGQIAFGFSNSGRSRAVVSVLKEAGKNGALTVGVANFRNTPLEEESDVFFCTSYPRHGEMTASLTARIATQGIMDAIYVLSAQYGNISGDVQYMDKTLEENLRLPPVTRAKQRRANKDRKQ